MGVARIRPAGKLESPWQLRIELLDVRPLVWRRLRVPANITLPKLHRVFQTALGWTNSHLHQFKVGGHRINPQEIEDIIIESGYAMECMVFGIPDPLLGHRLTGLVVPIKTTPDIVSSILEFCRKKLPKHKIPEKLLLVETIPKTSSGKPDRTNSIRLFENRYNKGEES